MSLLLLVLSELPASAETYIQLMDKGRSLQSKGDLEGALNAFSLAKSMVSGSASDLNSDPRLYLARLYEKLGRYSDADTEYQAMMAFSQEPTLKEEYAKFLMGHGNFNAAQSVWNDVLAKYPNDPAVLYNIAVCLESTDNIESARDYYQRVISLAPDSNAAANAQSRISRLSKAVDAQVSRKFFPLDPDLGAAGFGWWDLSKMPIHVYIDDGSQVSGYRAEMKQAVYRALDAWKNLSGGRISFIVEPSDYAAEGAWRNLLGKTNPLDIIPSKDKKLLNDPTLSSGGIHIHWIDKMYGAMGIALTNVYFNLKSRTSARDNLLEHAHIWICTNQLADGSTMPKITSVNQAILEKQDRIINEVVTHELGHALGLPHSSNPRDIMCSGIFALNSTDLVETRSLSGNDQASLREHYNGFEGNGLPAGTVLKKAAVLSSEELSKTSAEGSKSASAAESGSSTPNEETPQRDKKLDKARFAEIQMYDVLYDINSKHYSEGLLKLNQMLELNPENLQALYMRGVVNVMMHNFKEAEADYKSILKKSPGSELSRRAQEGLSKLKKAGAG